MPSSALDYQSFLLRLWLSGNAGQPTWRFSLQPTNGGPHRVFLSLNELMQFLVESTTQLKLDQPDETE